MSQTSKDCIIEKLKSSSIPLAVHEFGIIGYNENNLSTRLSEMSREGKVIGAFRKGTHYKEWRIPKASEQMEMAI